MILLWVDGSRGRSSSLSCSSSLMESEVSKDEERECSSPAC